VLHQRRGRDRLAQVVRHERDDLPAGLQDRHVRVQVDPVQALDVQQDVPVQEIVHRHDALRHAPSVRPSRRSRDP
jgi:hypothetical protein